MSGRPNLPNIPQCKIPCLEAIDQGVCHADCCKVAIVPFMQRIYRDLARFRQCEPEREVFFAEIVYPYREDATCVFLNRITNRCNIYHLRPQICANFGITAQCFHYTEEGKKLTRAEKRRGDYDTRESVKHGVELFEKVMKMQRQRLGSDESIVKATPVSQAEYAILRSWALPLSVIVARQFLDPDSVIDGRTIDLDHPEEWAHLITKDGDK